LEVEEKKGGRKEGGMGWVEGGQRREEGGELFFTSPQK
jgi:hypothetical protein